MVSYPKISIVTPVYNRVDFLEYTIQSVLNQSYPNLEYIIIDGGSSDGTIDIIKKYEAQISYWISEPDKGMYFALQKGFDRATGDIYTWINSDDLYHPNSLYIVAAIFSDLPKVEWITGIPSLYDKDGHCTKVFQLAKWSKHRILAGDYKWIQQESTFFRKSLWEEAGATINTEYKIAADFELWTRYFDLAVLYSVNTILAGFRLHGNQLSLSNHQAYKDEANEIYEQYFNKFSSNRKFLLRRVFYVGNRLSNSKFTTITIIGKLLSDLLRRMCKFSQTVYFDFVKSKWNL